MTFIARGLARKAAVARRFGASAGDYDAHAELQAQVAAHLASFLPICERPSVLEVGCGTGLLTAHLLKAYPEGDFLVTDLAPEMLEACKRRVGGKGGLRFAQMDGEAPAPDESFDVIAMSMTLQWFADPIAGLERLLGLLRPGGTLVYAAPGEANFPEWRAVLAAEGLPDGTVAMPPLPGAVEERNIAVAHPDGRSFLAGMRAIGAGEPRGGYAPLPPGALRRALRRLEREHGARVTWHIVFGQLSADT